jgi:hypothetical protein
MKQELHDNLGIPELLNWLGELHEIKAGQLTHEIRIEELHEAEICYQKSLELQRGGHRYYFECGALIGLARINHIQGNHSVTQSYLARAETLIQRYQYNDYAALSRLMQGHAAWFLDSDERLNSVLLSYKECLIYSLRYNRFLLDEVLAGKAQRTTFILQPVISICLEQEEGSRVLTALISWWQEGVNSLELNDQDTISPIPLGITLQDAEQNARTREKGDGSPQETLIEQIGSVLLT